MDIRLRIGTWLLPLLLFSAVLGVKGQLTESAFKERTYDLSWLRSSPNGKYISFQKNYESSSDTLALVAANGHGNIIYQTAGVYPNLLEYSAKGYLFITGPNSVRYLKLPSLKPWVWEGITKAIFLRNENKFAILQKGVLRIYGEEAQLLDKIADVSSVEQKQGQLFYLQEGPSSKTLVRWTKQSKQNVYTSEVSKVALDFFNGRTYLVHETDPVGGNVVLKYIAPGEGTVIPMETPRDLQLKTISAVSELAPGKFFITVTVYERPVKKSDVDIWYANDGDLAKKFQNGLSLSYFIWQPAQNELKELADTRFTRHLDPGNGRYLLALDPAQYQEYIRERIPIQLWRYDLEQHTYEELGVTGITCFIDPGGRYLLSHNGKDWVLFEVGTKVKKHISAASGSRPYFDEKGEKILFAGAGHITEYSIPENSMHITQIPKGFEATVLNGIKSKVGAESRFSVDYYDGSRPVLLKITNPETVEETLGEYRQGQFRLLYKPSGDYVNLGTPAPSGHSVLYLKSNYNSPPVLMINTKGREKELFRSNPADTAAAAVRMEKKQFRNSAGVPLQALLYYPTRFDPAKKYPMIVGIYELMRNQRNRYLRDGFSSRVEGLNIRYYLDRGYFVLLPDIVYDERGPGRSALDCVEMALDALAGISAVDFKKVGLIGHSHGGYQTNFIATQSKRFAAYVAGAGNSDLVRSYHSFNYNFVSPFYWQFEEQQYRMFKPFAADKNLYIDNSPIYHAEKVSSPILLWAGTKDENIAWDQTMEFYLGLRRNRKQVITLFYKGDGHSLMNKTNREDLFVRIADWFGYHLKGNSAEWIERGM